MRFKQAKLQKTNKKTLQFTTVKELQKDLKDIDKMMHYQKLLFIFEII